MPNFNIGNANSGISVRVGQGDRVMFATSGTPVVLDSKLAKWKAPGGVGWRTIATTRNLGELRAGLLSYNDADKRKILRNAVKAMMFWLRDLPGTMASAEDAPKFHKDFTMICVLRELLFDKALPILSGTDITRVSDTYYRRQ